MSTLRKYPRTPHLQGSRLQPGDEDLDAVPFAEVQGRHLVIEEKMDGANAGISFNQDGELLLQSRGHFLTGGPRERHFNLLKQWARAHEVALYEVLGSRYVMYGEWLYAKHTVFYDALPHYFLEFDILDQETGRFLSTERRRALLRGTPVHSVLVLREGPLSDPGALRRMIGPSRFKTGAWRERLTQVAAARSLDPERVARETDASDEMEGLYIKLEEDGHVRGRFKFVRASFLTTILDATVHWLDRPIVQNQLRPGVDLFDPAPPAPAGDVSP
jgi:hypothetical protein